MRSPVPSQFSSSRRKSLSIDADALCDRANALFKLRRWQEAFAKYDRALAIRPNVTRFHYNRGRAHLDLNDPSAALASLDRALASRPDDPTILYDRGQALFELKRYEEAAAAFDGVLALNPDHNYAKGEMLHAKLAHGDWRGYEQNSKAVIDDLGVITRIAEIRMRGSLRRIELQGTLYMHSACLESCAAGTRLAPACGARRNASACAARPADTGVPRRGVAVEGRSARVQQNTLLSNSQQRTSDEVLAPAEKRLRPRPTRGYVMAAGSFCCSSS